MSLRNLSLCSLLFIINNTAINGMQKIQTLRARLIAEIREDQKNLIEQKKNMIPTEYQLFNQAKQLCDKDKINDNLNTLCSSCMKTFNNISIGTQRFIHAENFLKKSTDYYKKVYGNQLQKIQNESKY